MAKKRYMSVYRNVYSFEEAFKELGIPQEEYSWIDDKYISYGKRLDDCVTFLLSKGWEIISVTKGDYGDEMYHFILET